MPKLSVDQVLSKAASFANRDEFSKAEKLYMIILKTFPDHKRAKKGLVKLQKLQNGDNATSVPQETIDALINLYNAHKHSELISQGQSLVEKNPKAFLIWNLLGASYKALGKVKEAIEAFNRVTELSPNNVEGYNNLGNTLLDDGRVDDAIEAYQKVLLLKPEYAYSHYNMGIALKTKGKLDESIKAFQNALKFKPDHAQSYNNLGIAFQNQNKLDDAIAAFDKALSIQPNLVQAEDNLIHLLTEHKPIKPGAHHLFEITKKLQHLSAKYLEPNIISDYDVISFLEEIERFFSNGLLSNNSNLSQAYRRNSKNLNCERHMSIFNQNTIIPRYCFSCYKVQVEPQSVIGLIQLFIMFDKLYLNELPSKS